MLPLVLPILYHILYVLSRFVCLALACLPSAAALACTALSKGLFWELNPGPLAPEARIMPLDQAASGLPLRMIVLHRMLSCACSLPHSAQLLLVVFFPTHELACGDSAVGSA